MLAYYITFVVMLYNSSKGILHKVCQNICNYSSNFSFITKVDMDLDGTEAIWRMKHFNI